MKKIAILFIIIFALVQAAPVVMAVFTDVSSFFIADEEKGEEKTAGDIKEKKYEADFAFRSAEFSNRLNTALHLAEKIPAHPSADNLTPPPNFC
ncbi:MAG TPA: hypothetical protein VF144_11340 [Chitinophagaceae bacterium]